MKNILVSGASGVVGYGILRSLRKSGEDLRLIGTSIYGDSAAQGFCDIFELAPPTNEASYIDWLLATIKKREVDLIIPGIEIDVYKWAEYSTEIQSSGAAVMLNNKELIRLCRDKWTFYQSVKNLPYAIETSLDTEYETLVKRYGSPFLLKPRCGFGSKGIVVVDCIETFMRHRDSIGPTLMAQPIVGSDEEEYTISVFGDGKGAYYASMTMKRKLSKDGFSEKAEVVSTDEFGGALSELCGIFHPLGPTNFQFRKTGTTPKLLEINPRISSSTSIRTAFGYNESAMAVNYFLQRKEPTQPEIRRGRAVRYTDELIFYEDSVHL
jgi:carbamoyl-phosphate synthase large subunit